MTDADSHAGLYGKSLQLYFPQFHSRPFAPTSKQWNGAVIQGIDSKYKQGGSNMCTGNVLASNGISLTVFQNIGNPE